MTISVRYCFPQKKKQKSLTDLLADEALNEDQPAATNTDVLGSDRPLQEEVGKILFLVQVFLFFFD
jgi:hypothetical protein